MTSENVQRRPGELWRQLQSFAHQELCFFSEAHCAHCSTFESTRKTSTLYVCTSYQSRQEQQPQHSPRGLAIGNFLQQPITALAECHLGAGMCAPA